MSRVESDRHYGYRGYGYRLAEAEELTSDEDPEDSDPGFCCDSEEDWYRSKGFQVRGRRDV